MDIIKHIVKKQLLEKSAGPQNGQIRRRLDFSAASSTGTNMSKTQSSTAQHSNMSDESDTEYPRGWSLLSTRQSLAQSGHEKRSPSKDTTVELNLPLGLPFTGNSGSSDEDSTPERIPDANNKQAITEAPSEKVSAGRSSTKKILEKNKTSNSDLLNGKQKNLPNTAEQPPATKKVEHSMQNDIHTFSVPKVPRNNRKRRASNSSMESINATSSVRRSNRRRVPAVDLLTESISYETDEHGFRTYKGVNSMTMNQETKRNTTVTGKEETLTGQVQPDRIPKIQVKQKNKSQKSENVSSASRQNTKRNIKDTTEKTTVAETKDVATRSPVEDSIPTRQVKQNKSQKSEKVPSPSRKNTKRNTKDTTKKTSVAETKNVATRSQVDDSIPKRQVQRNKSQNIPSTSGTNTNNKGILQKSPKSRLTETLTQKKGWVEDSDMHTSDSEYQVPPNNQASNQEQEATSLSRPVVVKEQGSSDASESSGSLQCFQWAIQVAKKVDVIAEGVQRITMLALPMYSVGYFTIKAGAQLRDTLYENASFTFTVISGTCSVTLNGSRCTFERLQVFVIPYRHVFNITNTGKDSLDLHYSSTGFNIF